MRLFWLGLLGFVVCATVLVPAVAQPLPSATPAVSQVTVRDLFLRAGPSEAFLPVSSVVLGTVLTPLGRNDDASWIAVRARGVIGWMRADLARWAVDLQSLPIVAPEVLTPIPSATFIPPTPTPTGNWVSAGDVGAFVRSGPGFTYAPLGILNTGDLVEPVGRTSELDWILIRFGSGFGWIARPLVRWTVELRELPILIRGNLTPSLTFTSTYTPSVTASVTPSATATDTPSATATVTPSATLTHTPSVTASVTPSATATETPSATATITPSATLTHTPTMTATLTPSATATETPSATATDTPGATLTHTPSVTATLTPSVTATETPSVTATDTPSSTLTLTPSLTATLTPSATLTLVAIIMPSPSITATLMVAAGAPSPTIAAVVVEVTTPPTATASPSPSATRAATSTLPPTATASLTAAPSLTQLAASATTPTPVMAGVEVSPTAATTMLTVTPQAPLVVAGDEVSSDGVPVELLVGVIAITGVLGYAFLYWRGLAALERYKDGFVIRQCPVCQQGNLYVETRRVRIFGIPRARHVVGCTYCRSVLREAGSRRWRYAVDRMDNPQLYLSLNGRTLNEDELRKISSQPTGDVPVQPKIPPKPPSFVDDDELRS